MSTYYVLCIALGLDIVTPLNKTDINPCPGHAYILVGVGRTTINLVHRQMTSFVRRWQELWKIRKQAEGEGHQEDRVCVQFCGYRTTSCVILRQIPDIIFHQYTFQEASLRANGAFKSTTTISLAHLKIIP